jgi:hypothetical protein
MIKLRKESYIVGWICTVPIPECEASQLLLDELHEDVRAAFPSHSSTAYHNACSTIRRSSLRVSYQVQMKVVLMFVCHHSKEEKIDLRPR